MQPPSFSLRDGPTFGDEDVGVAPGQLEPIANAGMFQVHAINHFRVLANEPDRHQSRWCRADIAAALWL